jgi:hypothetical protein
MNALALPSCEHVVYRATLSADVTALRLQAIERMRVTAGIDKADLAYGAGISYDRYRRILAKPALCGARLLAALERAVRQKAVRRRLPQEAQARLIRAAYGGFVAVLCKEFGESAELVHSDDPARRERPAAPGWQKRARIRQAALYLCNISLEVPQRRLADALGMTPAAVCLALRTIEDERDDEDFDRALAKAAKAITGDEA